MTLADLTLFIETARAGSFAAAARARGTDPSSVSRRIAALEASLGVRLLDRTTRRLSTTEAGRLVLERATGPLAELDALRETARDTVARPTGTLRLTASIAFAERWLIPRLPAFRALHPRIALDLDLTDTPMDLAERGIDLAFRLGPEPTGPYRARKLMDTAYRVVAAPAWLAAHPVDTPQDIAARPCIAFPFPGYRSCWILDAPDGTRAEIPITPALTVSNALAIRAAAVAGLGLALLPDWLTAEDRATGTLTDAFPDHRARASDAPTAAWLLTPIRPYLPARLRAFTDWLDTAS